MPGQVGVRHIGLFGGSFNPVHIGHILTATSVCDQLCLNELRFIPAARSPFKTRPQIEDRHRIALLALATDAPGAHPAFKLDLRELNSEGPSYTIDTLSSIASEQAGDHLYLVIGMDAWLEFERWKAWQSLLDLCHLVVMTRPDYARPTLSSDWQARQIQSIEALRRHRTGKLFFIPVPASRAASSMIRQRLGAGTNASEFLTDSVAAYIHQHQLYQ